MADLKREVKIQAMVENFNISEEYALKILKTEDEYLSINELQMKYNNPDTCKLPDWLSEEELSAIIWKSIQSRRSYLLNLYKSEEDLFQELQLFVRLKSNKIINHKYLKALICNRLLSYVEDTQISLKYIPCNLEDNKIISNNNEEGLTLGDTIEYGKDLTYDMNVECLELCTMINSIKDKQVRNFLIVTGYILCNINELKTLYIKLKNECSSEVQLRLEDLEERLKYLDETERIKGKAVIKSRELNVIQVIKALDIKIEDPTSKGLIKRRLVPSKVLEELQYYIKGQAIFNV